MPELSFNLSLSLSFLAVYITVNTAAAVTLCSGCRRHLAVKSSDRLKIERKKEKKQKKQERKLYTHSHGVNGFETKNKGKNRKTQRRVNTKTQRRVRKFGNNNKTKYTIQRAIASRRRVVRNTSSSDSAVWSIWGHS